MNRKGLSDRTVLLVEDELRISRFMSISLRVSDYHVIAATSGEQALDEIGKA